jgi:hypothetical protein
MDATQTPTSTEALKTEKELPKNSCTKYLEIVAGSRKIDNFCKRMFEKSERW